MQNNPVHTSHHQQLPSNFKKCHHRFVGKLDSWEGSQKHNSYDI